MVSDEEMNENWGLLNSMEEAESGPTDDTKLLLSLHSVDFSEKRVGYWEVASDIYFSNFIYLLYVRNVEAGKNFERAKEKTKSVLIYELEKKKYALLAKTAFQGDHFIDFDNTGRKLILLDRAISVLESCKSESAFPNCEIYGVS